MRIRTKRVCVSETFCFYMRLRIRDILLLYAFAFAPQKAKSKKQKAKSIIKPNGWLFDFAKQNQTP